MSTITREQLIPLAQEDVAKWRDAMKHNVNTEYAAIRLRLAEIALASLEAEPIGFAFADDVDLMRKKIKVGGMLTVRHQGEAALYTAPPAPVSLDAGDKLSNFITSQELLGKDFEKVLAENIEGLYVPGNTAPPAPVSVPDEVLARLEHEANHLTAWHHIDEHSCKVNRRDLLTLVNACRAAMLQGAEPVTTAYKSPELTDTQCLEFLAVAFRHARIKGDIEFDDIRLGLKLALEAAPQQEA